VVKVALLKLISLVYGDPELKVVANATSSANNWEDHTFVTRTLLLLLLLLLQLSRFDQELIMK